MKAIRVSKFGAPDVLVLEELERPRPGKGEALVRIAAAGVNYRDIYERTGRYGGEPPLTAGAEGSGTVEAIGEGVTEVRAGDRVAFTGLDGTYAEYIAAPADRLIPIPNSISFEEAAAFPLQGMTAHYLVHDFYHIREGTTLLVHAAAGGVGLLVTQLAKHLGARVIGTTSTPEKAAIAMGAGANSVILYTQTDFVEETKRLTNGTGVDLVLDGVGKTTFPGSLQAVRIRGTVVIYGSSSGPADPIAPNSLQTRSLMLGAGTLPNFIASREELLRRANDVMNGLREGWLKLRIDRTFPLTQAADAQRLLESRGTSGKLVLIC
jgi:NADPH:quinone reductase